MHQTMSGFFPSETLRVLTNRGKHAQTMPPHCQIQLEQKHIPSENPIHPSPPPPINLINRGKKNCIFKKETNVNFHMD